MKAEQDDTIDINNDTETNPPDYSTHQHNNSKSIIHELPTLQQHTRGVLLVGSVLGAAGLPFSTSSQGGDLSFKILFIEGGSQPAMFRCKTPIYSSDTVTISKNPRWDNGIFHFDMIMPESKEDLKSEYGFVIQGEISITIYQSRVSGGNNIIGQASFDLADIVKTGTIEFFQAGFEGRSVTGSHLLLSRTREIVGEVDVQLNIAWKSMNKNTTITTTVGNESNITNKAGMIRSSSAVAGKRLPRQLDSSTNKTSDNSKAPSNKRPITANTTTTAAATVVPIKIVSKLQKKQKEDNKRINQENLRMLKLLQHYGNNKDVYNNNAPPKDSSPVVVTVNQAESKQKDNNDNANNDSKKKINMKVSSSVDNNNKSSSSSHEYYLNIFNNLKKEIRQEIQENDKLKSRLSTLKINVNKAELTINKIKGGNSSNSRSSNSIISNNNGYGSKMQFESNFMKNLSMEAAGKDDDDNDINDDDNSRRKPSSISNSKDELKGIYKQNNIITITPVITPLTDDELIAMNINDGEYRSLAEEYNVLQSVRRGLIDRLIVAKKTCKKAENTQISISERIRFLQHRLSYLQDIVGEQSVNMALSLININNHTDVGSKGSDDNGGTTTTTTITKLIPVSSHTQVEVKPNKRSDGDEDNDHNDHVNDDDYLLFDRLRKAKEQDELETLIYQSKTHFLSHDSSILELKGIFHYLQDKYNKLKTSIDNYREESKLNQNELYELTKNDKVLKMRENISKMKLRLKMLQLQSKLKMVDEEQFTVDAELTSFRYRQQLRLVEGVQSGDYMGSRGSGGDSSISLDKDRYNSTPHTDTNDHDANDYDAKDDDTQITYLKSNTNNNNPTIPDNNQSDNDVISNNSKDAHDTKSSSTLIPIPITATLTTTTATTTTTTALTGSMKPKKVKKHNSTNGGGARFSDDIVSSVVVYTTDTDSDMMMINDQDKEKLYYNTKDEDSFKLQMSEEIDKADGLGLTWQQWMDTTDDDNDEKSTLDLTLTTNPNALVNNDVKDRNLI